MVFRYLELVLRRGTIAKNVSAAGPNKNENVIPIRFASSQFTVVRHTRTRSGIVRSSWYTAPNVSAPAAFTFVPAWYRFISAGYRESTQNIVPITTINTTASVRLRQAPTLVPLNPILNAGFCTDTAASMALVNATANLFSRVIQVTPNRIA